MQCKFSRGAALALVIAGLAGCGKREALSEPTAAQALQAHARALVKAHPEWVAEAGQPHVTVGQPLTYLTYFSAASAQRPTTAPSDSAKAAVPGIGHDPAWSALYCGPEVQAILRKFGIVTAAASVLDEAGKERAVAFCVVDGP